MLLSVIVLLPFICLVIYVISLSHLPLYVSRDIQDPILKLVLQEDQELLESYDYIVIGGGSAGTLAASRLAQSGASILLLEAGFIFVNLILEDRMIDQYRRYLKSQALVFIVQEKNRVLNGIIVMKSKKIDKERE